MLGSRIHSDGIDLTTRGCVYMNGGSKAEEKGEGQITKFCVCQAKGFGFYPQATGYYLLIFSRKVTYHISF